MKKMIMKLGVLLISFAIMTGCSSDSSSKNDKTISALELKTTTVSVKAGENFSLPTTCSAIMTDNSTSVANITWDKTADTSKEGTYTFKGTVAGTDKTVVFTINVMSAVAKTRVELSDLTVSKNSEFTVDLSAVLFKNKTSGFDIRIKYNPAELSLKNNDVNEAVNVVGGFTKALNIIKEDTKGEIIIASALLSGDTDINGVFSKITFVAKETSTKISCSVFFCPTEKDVEITDLGVITVK